MTKKEKKVILIIVGIMIVVIVGIMFFKGQNKPAKQEEKGNNISTNEGNNNTTTEQEKYVTNLDEGTKINNSGEFNQDKKYKNLEITNIQYTYKNGTSVLLANVKNTAGTPHEAEIVNITMLGEDGKAIDEIEALLPTIAAGETEQLNVSFSGADRVNAKDFKIEAK